MIIKKISIILLAVLLLAACGQNLHETADFALEEPSAGLAQYDRDTRSQNLSFGANANETAASFEEESLNEPIEMVENGAVQIPERLIIRSADLSLVVADTEASLEAITDMVEANGGWVVSSNIYNYQETKQGTITVRVPADGFNSALDAMKGLAVEVNNESISGQDVTEEFVDLSLRLENLESTADRVREFLVDAKRVEDALAVNQELSRLEGEIEMIKGRREFLSQSAKFSTITVTLIPDVLSNIEIAGWRPKGIANDAIEALVETLQQTGSFLIWVGIYILPMVLLYGIPLVLVIRLGRRWWRNHHQAPDLNQDVVPLDT